MKTARSPILASEEDIMGRKNNYRGKGRGRGKKEKKVFPQVVGRVQMTREGYAFIIIEGEEDDVFVKASTEIPCACLSLMKRPTVSVVKEKSSKS